MTGVVVKRNGSTERYSADIVVTSCGAINSAALLLRSANDRGYECLLLEDCTESYFPAFKAAAVEMMRAQGAIVGWTATSAQLLAAL